jgi:enterochelin esterase-like enzyme
MARAAPCDEFVVRAVRRIVRRTAELRELATVLAGASMTGAISMHEARAGPAAFHSR